MALPMETVRHRVEPSVQARRSWCFVVRADELFSEPLLHLRPSPSRIAVAGCAYRAFPPHGEERWRMQVVCPTVHLRRSG